jgi:hypothetical protein
MLRLYITLYGVLFIAFGLFVTGTVLIPEVALRGTFQSYYERAMFGVFGLVEERLKVHPQAQWDRVIKTLAPKFRHGLELYDWHSLPVKK